MNMNSTRNKVSIHKIKTIFFFWKFYVINRSENLPFQSNSSNPHVISFQKIRITKKGLPLDYEK